MSLDPQMQAYLDQAAALNLAPMHTFPPEIVRQGMVGGDSAGGNLAAVVTLMARDQGGPPLVFQLLIYPVTDATGSSPSMIENEEGYGLTQRDMIWFTNHYLNNEDEQRNPLASPLLAPNLSGLPPALIITAEYDPLRDEAELYAQRVKDAGIPVTMTRYNGAIHGFVSRPFDLGKKALRECSDALQGAFA